MIPLHDSSLKGMNVVLTSNKPSKAPVVPPIPLIKEEEKAYAKGSYTTLKLRSNPAEENSPIDEIQVFQEWYL